MIFPFFIYLIQDKFIHENSSQDGDHFGPWPDDLKWGELNDFESFYISGLVYASRYIRICTASPDACTST